MIEAIEPSECLACKQTAATLVEGLCELCLGKGWWLGILDEGAGDTDAEVLAEPKPHEGVSAARMIFPEIVDFEVLSFLAEGGFSLVYRGEQLRPIRRPVAIKILKRGLDTEEMLTRFEEEQAVIARLDHPNIARVIHAGETKDGRPFLAMELIDGYALTDYCKSAGLLLTERLELFRDACEAIHHAHQRGVIHRDLKPSNILVRRSGGRAALKVIDFGLAKMLEERPLGKRKMTLEGVVMGTPEYMSPEQLAHSGDIDIRSDIYSLGLLLYELVAGRHPLAGKDLEAMPLHQACELMLIHQPQNPSVTAAGKPRTAKGLGDDPEVAPMDWSRQVRGELDWIILKALEKDRNDRYSSAAGLAQDVSAFLQHLPVSAARPTAAYYLRKLLRRNRVPAVAMAVSAVPITSLAMVAIKQFSERNALQHQGRSTMLANQQAIDATAQAGAASLENLAASVPARLEDSGLISVMTAVTETQEAYLKLLTKEVNPGLTTCMQAKISQQRSLIARWSGDLPAAIRLARISSTLLDQGNGPLYPASRVTGSLLLADLLDDSYRPAEAVEQVAEALKYFAANPPPAPVKQMACLAARTEMLVHCGRSQEAREWIDQFHSKSNQTLLAADAAAIGLLAAQGRACLECLDFQKATETFRQAQEMLHSVPATSRTQRGFQIEESKILEAQADLLERTAANRDPALGLFTLAHTLRAEILRRDARNAVHQEALVNNRLQLGEWLLDLAVAIAADGAVPEDVIREAEQVLSDAAGTLPLEDLPSNTNPCKRCLHIRLATAKADLLLLSQRPLEALDLLMDADEAAAQLMRDSQNDTRLLGTQSRLLCLLANCYQQMDTEAKAIEAMSKEAKLTDTGSHGASLNPRDWLRLSARYARIGRMQEAAEVLTQALAQFPLTPAAAVFKHQLQRIDPPK